MKINALSLIIDHLEAFEKMTKTKLELTSQQKDRLKTQTNKQLVSQSIFDQ